MKNVSDKSCGENKNMHFMFISVFNQLDAQNLFHNKFYFYTASQ